MNQLLETFIGPPYFYRFTQGPDVVRTKNDAIQYGNNCISLAQLALKDLFQKELSPDLHCYELFLDRENFEAVDSLTDMVTGDLVWLGRANPAVELANFVPHYESGQILNWSECPIRHVAIHTGGLDEHDDYLLLHASPTEGTNVVWPLSKFRSIKRYRKIYGITRLKQEPSNMPVLAPS